MGVMACSRLGCKHSMCHIMALNNYICVDCYNELLEHKSTWPDKMTKGNLLDRIEAFMQTEPGTYVKLEEVEDIDAEFNKLVRRCKED